MFVVFAGSAALPGLKKAQDVNSEEPVANGQPI